MGTPDAAGEMEFAFAGQVTSWPARFCIGPDDAVALARWLIADDGRFAEPDRWWLEPDKDLPAF
jgi:hypothetical protein